MMAWQSYTRRRKYTRARGPIFLVYGTEDGGVAPAIPATAATLAAAGIAHDVLAVEGADHIFMRHAWKQTVIAATVAWLREQWGA